MILTGCTSNSLTEGDNSVTWSTQSRNTDTTNPLCDILTPSSNLTKGEVLELAKEERADAYAFTKEEGAEIIPVDEDRSYAVWWEPDGFDIENDTVLVTLHGHGEWAVQGFNVWHDVVEKRGYAFLAPQWWFGRSLENEGYYEPDQIYAIIQAVLEEKGVPPEHVIFEGFSMGSARSYAVTLYDKHCGGGYFGVSIANSGQWEDNYPLYTNVLSGDYGDQPFEDTHWILFCGEQDENEYGRVCDGMDHTADVLTELGGTVDLFIKDPKGDHGSFNMNDDNENNALDAAEAALDRVQSEPTQT